MGAVYEAEHVELGSKVAVKLLSESFTADETSRARFRREARAAAAARHENIVYVSDAGTDDDGTPFLVMELLRGESLNALLKRHRRLKPDVAIDITTQVLAGLAAAHEHSVVHRDLKPANIFLLRNEDQRLWVKILDFGISKFAADTTGTALTRTGVMVGTPQFMAPEQIESAKDADARSDIFGAGVMLYSMVTGLLPFAPAPREERLAAIRRGDFPSPRDRYSEVPEALEKIILKAMEPAPDDRYASATAFRDALLAVRAELPESTPSETGEVATPTTRRLTDKQAPITANELEKRITGATGDADVPATARKPPAAPTHRARALWVAAAVALAAALGVSAFWLARDGSSSAAKKNTKDGAAAAPATAPAAEGGLRLGMTTYVPSDVQHQRYGPIVDYLAEKLGRGAELVIFAGDEALRRELRAGKLDLVALNPHSYVLAKQASPDIHLLATPVTPGGSSFQVHVVVGAESGISRLEDLRGKIFCYVPSAASGYLFPRSMLRKAGLDPDTSFKTTRLADDHLSALRHVHSGRCDATSVYASLLFEADKHGLSPYWFRILGSTRQIPNDAYCARADLDAAVVDNVRAALLALEPGSPTAAEVFPSGGEIIGFTAVEDSAFDQVRAAVEASQPADGGR